jgi:hypothetical protein
MAEENGEQERAARLAELEKETARLKAERKRIEDELEILSYAIPLSCSIGADVRQSIGKLRQFP